MCGSRGVRDPGPPLVLRKPDAQAIPAPHERHPQQERLLCQSRKPPLLGILGGAKSKVGKPPAVPVEHGLDAEPLHEATQFARRCRAYGEIYEVCPDAAFGEKAQRLARVRALANAEDLYFHEGEGKDHKGGPQPARRWTSRRPSHIRKTSTWKPQTMTPPANPSVCLSTSHGDITVELFADKAPVTVENFLAYVDAGFFADTVFHRVIPDFMIQGGGFTSDMRQKPTRSPIKNEADNGVKNARGTLAMARTSDIHSATAQFFINLKDNTFLDHGSRDFGYAVFGRVTAGMDVVDKIAAVKTGRHGPHADVPAQPVVIRSAARQ
jgi:peptidyl-prolyl cis-trans isomerase A (cyclophilin A)